jgi:hypothetical protein
LLKKIILTLIGIGLLLGFQATTNSNFHYENFTIADIAEDGETSEKENHELKDWKFFDYTSQNFTTPKTSSRFIISKFSTSAQNILEVPTSPPNV